MTLPSYVSASLLAGALALTAIAWLRAIPALRGSTLVGPWLWSLVALLAIVVGGGGQLFFSAGIDQPLAPRSPRAYLAAITILCPSISLLGAKRPQHQAWHFVVAALWCVLALPGLQAWLFGTEAVTVTTILGAFMLVLLTAELLNRLYTRMWLVGVLQAGAGLILLSPFLPLVQWLPVTRRSWPLGLLMECAAIGLGSWIYRRRRRGSSWNDWWFEFRDSFGVLWSLRVQERVNSAARQYGWPVRLRWSGFQALADAGQAPEQALDSEQRAACQRTLENLLRRFLARRDAVGGGP